MGLISVSLPSDGSTADVSDYNVPITTIVTLVNGNLDNSNIAAGAAIDGSKIANQAITPNRLNLSPQTATVITSETTTSGTYADLTTTTDTVTVVVGVNGVLFVTWGARISNSAGGSNSLMSVDLSGANTVAATSTGDNYAILVQSTAPLAFSNSKMFTGLTVGSTVVKLKYRVSGGTGTFVNRHIEAIAL